MLSPYSALRLVRQRIHVLCSSFSLGDEFKIVSVFRAQLGLIVVTCSASAYRAFGMVAVFSVMLGSTVDTRLCVILRSLVCSSSHLSGPDARHHGRYGQKDGFALSPCSDMCKAGIAGDTALCAVFARI